MKSFQMTQAVNLVRHLASLQISLFRYRLFSHYIQCKKHNLHTVCLHAFLSLCCTGWDLVWPLLKAQQGYSETKEKSVSKSNPQSAHLHVQYVCLDHNWYVLTKKSLPLYIPSTASRANKRVSTNLLKIRGASHNSTREVSEFTLIVAYSRASKRLCCFNATNALAELNSVTK